MALLKFLQKHKAVCEARLCSKETSDPIHSDTFWQKENSRKVQMVNLRVLLYQEYRAILDQDTC